MKGLDTEEDLPMLLATRTSIGSALRGVMRKGEKLVSENGAYSLLLGNEVFYIVDHRPTASTLPDVIWCSEFSDWIEDTTWNKPKRNLEFMKAELYGLSLKWSDQRKLTTHVDFGTKMRSRWNTSLLTRLVPCLRTFAGQRWDRFVLPSLRFDRFVLEDSGELVGYSSPETGSLSLWNSSSGLLVFHKGKLPAVADMNMYGIIPAIPYKLIRHLPETTAHMQLHDIETFILDKELTKASPSDPIREMFQIALQKQSDCPALNLTTLGDDFFESLHDYLSTPDASQLENFATTSDYLSTPGTSELEDFVASCLLRLRSKWYRVNYLVDPYGSVLLPLYYLDPTAQLQFDSFPVLKGCALSSSPSPSYRGKGWRWFSRQPDIMLHNHSSARISVRLEKFSEDKFELVKHYSMTQRTGGNEEPGIPPQHFIRERVRLRYNSWCAMSGDWTSREVSGGGVYFVKEVDQNGSAVLHLNKLEGDCTCTYCRVVN